MPHVIPHFFHSSEQACGPACLRMLAAARGLTLDEATIALHCAMTQFGCTVNDLVSGAQRLGPQAQLMPNSSEQAAIAALSNSTPFVAMIDLAGVDSTLPPFQWHFVVPLDLANNVLMARIVGRRSTTS
jgi:ABC-type bacteriocin/lantibiotic exporter with double-glycine peptidase domain